MSPSEIKWIIRGVVGLVLLVLLFVFSPFGTVDAGHRGVMLTMNKVGDNILGEGFYMRIPFVQHVVELPVRIVKIQVSAPAYTKDTQVVDTVIALNYKLDAAKVNLLYRDIGPDWESVIIQPAIQESVKSVIAKYTSQQLLDLRPQIKDEIKSQLLERLSKTYMTVDEFSVNDFSFSDQYEASIERKQIAKQDALTAEAKLSQIEFEAKQKVESATADATAIRIQAQAITQQGGEEYVRLQAVKGWDGHGCTTNCWGTGTQTPIPFFNLNK